MSAARVKELTEKKHEELARARAISEKAEKENRDFTDEERASVKDAIEKARDFDAEVKKLEGDDELLEQMKTLAGTEPGEIASTGAKAKTTGSIGQRFTEADAVKEWLGSVSLGDGVAEKTRIQSPPVRFDGMKDLLGRKDIVSGSEDDRAGALIDHDFRGLLDGLGIHQQPLNVRSLITSGTTDSDTVTFARVASTTSNAAPVAEATGTSAGTGSGDVTGEKPESDLTLEQAEATVRTLAHWLPATRQALSDASQVRTLIDNFLLYGLEEELETQVLTGDGTGQNFTGILETDGISEEAWDTDGDLLSTARKAKTTVRLNGRTAATAYVLNPEDNERVDLTTDGEDRYYFGGPASVGVQTLWGLPRVESELVPAGTGIVANWRWAVLWDRQSAGIMVSDSHNDFFVRNLIAILAEMRAAFGVIRPGAFCTFPTVQPS